MCDPVDLLIEVFVSPAIIRRYQCCSIAFTFLDPLIEKPRDAVESIRIVVCAVRQVDLWPQLDFR